MSILNKLDTFDSHLSVLTTIILSKYLNNSNIHTPCLLEIFNKTHPNGFIIPTVSDLPKMKLSQNNLNIPDLERCENILISTQNPFETFGLIEDFIQKRSEIRYNNRRYFIILLDGAQDCGLRHGKVNNICGDLDKLKFVFDVLVMTCDVDNIMGINDLSDKKCVFYTYKIKENGTIGWIHLDDWFWKNQSFVFHRNLYPDRLLDVDRIFGNEFRKLRAGATDYLPYSFIEPKMGMELKAIEEYIKKYNFKLEIVNDDEYWGEILSNWTGTGVLGGVATDKYDIGFSALFALPDRILYSDFSRPTAFSCVSCIVPAPRNVVSWTTPIKGLTAYIWIAVILTFFIVAITITIIKRFLSKVDKKLKHIKTLSVFSLFLMQPLVNTQIPIKFPLRLIYTVLLVFALLITTVYNSRLASLLVLPTFEGEINTVEDLASSGVFWGELAIDWILPLKVDERPSYKTVYNNFRVADEDTLRTYSQRNSFAFGMERLTTGYYAVGSYLQVDVITKYRAMKSDLYRQYTCLQLRKNSVLLPSIDELLMQTWEFGLLYYWEDEIIIHHMNHDVQQSLRHPPTSDTQVELQMYHVYGLFLVWSVGIILSVTTFIVELYLHRRNKRSTIIYVFMN